MPQDWFTRATAGSSCGTLAQSVDWASLPVGHPDTWPDTVRAAVELCFSTRFPIVLAWGPRLTMIYNDGYSAMLGTKRHPLAMGQPLADVWADIWDDLEPLVEQVMSTGQATFNEDERLFTGRSGYLEESAFTFSYSPVRDGGRVIGMLDIAVETTEQVVATRRLSTLGVLSTSLQAAGLDLGACAAAAGRVLAESEDVTRADVHLRVGTRFELLASTHAEADGQVDDGVLETVCRTRGAIRAGDAQVEPLFVRRTTPTAGAVALWGNPHRPDDEGQRLFLHLVGVTLGNALAAALTHQSQLDDVQAVSAALQAAMLPHDPGAPSWHTRYRPADDRLAVGGDWHDVIHLSGGRHGLVVGDCVGHGLGAAAIMGQLRSAARALLLQDLGPAAMLSGLDRFAATLPGAECASVVCALVDEAAGTVTYASAGHPPPLLLGADGPRWLDADHGTLLGVSAASRHESTTTFGADETLVLYTDGLVERRGESLSQGLSRLAGMAVQAIAGGNRAPLADLLIAALVHDGARDDVALVVYTAS